jgi:NAD(P)H-hydrate epimerase
MPAPVISVGQMREWEQASWAAGRSQPDVIARVGEIVAQRARRMLAPGDSILILAGKGHNGDDARAAREHLSDFPVRLLNVKDPETAIAEIINLAEHKPALVIDGLFGIGLNRALDNNWCELLQRINDLKTRVLAVDVPSGLNADTGAPEGAAIHATVTLTLGAPKMGMLLPSALPCVGRLELAPDIGLVPCPLASETNWILPTDFENFPPDRPVTAHKGEWGHLAIIAGSLGYHGAAVLTARGAQRSQPGLITLFTQENVYHSVAPQLQAVMVHLWHPNIKLPGDFNAVLVGPGLAASDLPDAMKMSLRHLWRDSPVPVIVDASAIDWLPHAPVPKQYPRIITPHPGEAARLLRATAQHVQADRPNALREISRRLGNSWVVLKGHQTLIGRSTGTIHVNSSGNPSLAQGGSGDLLAGYLAGLLAQPALQSDLEKTICNGVWQHGAAADRLTAARNNWVIEDLAQEIGFRPPRTACPTRREASGNP